MTRSAVPERAERRELYVGGAWVPHAGPLIAVTNPATEEVVTHVADASPKEVDRAVTAARTAFDHGPWPRLEMGDRIAAVERLLLEYGELIEPIAEAITLEMGAPITFATLVHAGMPWAMLSTFCDIARGFPWQTTRSGALVPDVMVRYQPVGVVAAVTPWNFPQFLTMSKLAPSLLAGCTVALKPSPNAPLDAYLLAEAIERADLPPGVFNLVPCGAIGGEALVCHRGVDKVAFTGSTAVGRTIGAICGAQLKRCTLELGGKSAAIVLDDADVTRVVDALRTMAYGNTGQVCIAQSRVLVPRKRHDEVVDALTAMVADLRLGDPTDPETELGPLVSAAHLARVSACIEGGEAEGARLVAGGVGRPDGMERGFYARPTVFAEVENSMRIAQDEVFGPVVSVIPYEGGDAAAVDLANDSKFGLGGSVWTADPARGFDVARRIRAGSFGINDYLLDFAAPFGGIGDSGFGRELGPEGFAAYLDSMCVVGDLSGARGPGRPVGSD